MLYFYITPNNYKTSNITLKSKKVKIIVPLNLINLSMFMPTSCNSHTLESGCSPLLIPLANDLVQVPTSGFISWRPHGDVGPGSDLLSSPIARIAQHCESFQPHDPGGLCKSSWEAGSGIPWPQTECVIRWQKRGGRTPSVVWCVSGEVWTRSDSCREDPGAATGRGWRKPSRMTSSPRR